MQFQIDGVMIVVVSTVQEDRLYADGTDDFQSRSQRLTYDLAKRTLWRVDEFTVYQEECRSLYVQRKRGILDRFSCWPVKRTGRFSSIRYP